MDVVTGRELDLDDLYTTPHDGNRWEILDGAFVVTPAPSVTHQYAAGELHVRAGAYVEGDAAYEAREPVPVRVVPALLTF